MKENIPADQSEPFVWVVYSMKKLKLGVRNLFPRFLLVGEGDASEVLSRLYTPFFRMAALNH